MKFKLSLLYAVSFPLPLQKRVFRFSFLLLREGGERDWQHRTAVEFPSPWLTCLGWSYREDFGMSVQANWLDS